MTIEEQYKKDNLKMQKRLKEEIHRISLGCSRRDMGELNKILEEIVESYDCKGKKMYFPRAIIDSWDNLDPLGEDLLLLNALYKKWK